MSFVDVYWLVVPAFEQAGPAPIAARFSRWPLGSEALGGLMVRQLKRLPLLPLHDPRFEGALEAWRLNHRTTGAPGGYENSDANPRACSKSGLTHCRGSGFGLFVADLAIRLSLRKRRILGPSSHRRLKMCVCCLRLRGFRREPRADLQSYCSPQQNL